MIVTEVIQKAQSCGALLTLSHNKRYIQYRGERTIIQQLLPILKEYKTEITEELLTQTQHARASPEPPQAKPSFENTLSTAYWWRICYADGSCKKVRFSPGWTIAEVLAKYPGAVSIEPNTSVVQESIAPLNTYEEHQLRAWFNAIGKTDNILIDQTIQRCQQDQDVRDYFLERALTELPQRASFDIVDPV